jgi:4-nitrophenyl phosphatase
VALVDGYAGILLDLDGVLYRGDDAVPGAPETVEELRGRGRRVGFLTNNSARTPRQVADRLSGMGIAAAADEVVTSAQATAVLLHREATGRTEGATAFVIGKDGIREALTDAGVRILDGDAERATYVVIGWDSDVSYDSLRRASVLVGAGAQLVATNADASYPAPGGELWPGAGAILAAVETATGVRATVAGKPYRPLFETAMERLGTTDVLMVGDRIETDVLGAADAGIDSALVLSGVSTASDLLDHDVLPVAVLRDVRGLLDEAAPAPVRPAAEADRHQLQALTAELGDVAEWSPDGTWIAGDLDATASAEVRGADGYLRTVVTEPNRRGAGLGTIAAAAATIDARRRGASRLWLLTETAEGFFARLGFHRADRSEVPRWILDGPGAGCPVEAVPMRRSLGQ